MQFIYGAVYRRQNTVVIAAQTECLFSNSGA